MSTITETSANLTAAIEHTVYQQAEMDKRVKAQCSYDELAAAARRLRNAQDAEEAARAAHEAAIDAASAPQTAESYVYFDDPEDAFGFADQLARVLQISAVAVIPAGGSVKVTVRVPDNTPRPDEHQDALTSMANAFMLTKTANRA